MFRDKYYRCPISGETVTPYHKLVSYYFSGTGNSKSVALWLSNVATENKIDNRLVNIAMVDRVAIEPPDPDALIAFISPIHGFNYPPIMLYFIMRFPKGKNSVLLMNTRAGMLIGKWVTPGLTGVAFYLAAFILKLKGYSIKAMFPVDLPSNWISIHPGLNERTVLYLHEKNKERVTVFAKKVLSGKSDFKGLRDIIQDIFISPVSLGYFFAGRFVIAKTFYASSACDDCDVCIKGCPVKAIIKIDKRPYWTFHCESCMKCMSTCPKRAVETAHGHITAVSLIFSLVLVGLFRLYVDTLFPEVKNETFTVILENLLFVGFLAVSYRIIHYCMRCKLFERLIVYTSLTHYKFWGRRYRSPKNL